MAKTIVGLFERFDDAQAAAEELISAGLRREDVSVVAPKGGVPAAAETSDMDAGTGSGAAHGAAVGAGTGAVVGGVAGGILAGLGLAVIPGIGPILAMGPIASAIITGAGVGALAGGLIGALVNAGVPEDEARVYEEGVRRGRTLVTVRAEDAMADRAADILNRHHALDVDSEEASHRTAASTAGATTRPAASTGSMTTTSAASRTGAEQAARPAAGQSSSAVSREGETRIPIVEEEIQVGKRQVNRGGARIHTHVVQKPVEERVQLREEHVSIERRPTDRPATEADFQAKDGTIEVRETAEEAVVQKRARVVEEVVVKKQSQERTQTVRDTVRRTDVEVEQLSGQDQAGGQGRGAVNFQSLDPDFRKYHESSAARSGATYDQCRPAYEYGYQSGGGHRGRAWNDVESDLRTGWERNHPGTWERFKDSIRYSWDKAVGKV